MKKILMLALSAALVLSFAACGNRADQPSESTEPIIGGDPATWGPAIDGDSRGAENNSSDENVQIANPFTEYENLEDAIAAAGFDMAAPDSIEGYFQKIVRVLDADSKMIEVIYENDEENNEGNEIRIRKAQGADDISGDYNVYAEENVVAVGDNEVTLKGNDGMVNLAIWVNGDYTYSIVLDSGITSENILNIVSSVQ